MKILLHDNYLSVRAPEGCIYNNEIFPAKGIEVVDSSGCGGILKQYDYKK